MEISNNWKLISQAISPFFFFFSFLYPREIIDPCREWKSRCTARGMQFKNLDYYRKYYSQIFIHRRETIELGFVKISLEMDIYLRYFIYNFNERDKRSLEMIAAETRYREE